MFPCRPLAAGVSQPLTLTPSDLLGSQRHQVMLRHRPIDSRRLPRPFQTDQSESDFAITITFLLVMNSV